MKYQKFLRNKNDSFELLFAGDTSFGENYQEKTKSKGGENILERFGYEYPLEKLKPIMMSADFVVINLETPITDMKKSPFAGQKQYLHWTDIHKTPETLLKHNVSLVSLANNHTFDYGKPGFDQTLQILQDHHLPMIGAGNTLNQAMEPFIGEIYFEDKKFIFAIIAAFEVLPRYGNHYQVYSDQKKPGLMPLDLELISSQVHQIKKADPNTFVILFPHWGKNYSWRDEKQMQLSEQLFSCGVDLIIGHGAHMIQEFARNNGSWVLFSLGNFMFNSKGRYERYHAPPFSYVAALSIQLVKNNFVIALKLYPILCDNEKTHYQPRFLNEDEFKDFYQLVAAKVEKNDSLLDVKKDQFGYYLQLPIVKELEKEPPPIWIGMICRALKVQKFEKHIYLWMFRAFVIERELIKHNYKLICYSPANVNFNEKTITGYILENGQFIEKCMPIPKMNYDFHISSTERQAYRYFIRWATHHNYEIYPDKSIQKLVKDKLLTHQMLLEYNKSLVPYTEIFAEDVKQLQSYLQENPIAFLKPRYGSMGNGILVIKAEKNQYLIDYYINKEKQTIIFQSLLECLPYIKKNINNEEYIIQEAVDVIRYEGSVFDIRAFFFNVEKNWNFLSEVRIGARANEVSNISQGGRSYNTTEFLSQPFFMERFPKLLENIKNIGAGIASFLNDKCEGKIIEICFDFLIDKVGKIYIAELNTKPGLTGGPEEYSNFFQVVETEKRLQDTIKYGEYLAQSLLAKHRKKRLVNQKYWFQDIKTSMMLDNYQAEKLLNIIYDALTRGQLSIYDLPENFPTDNTPRAVFLSISDDISIAKTYLGFGEGVLPAVNAALKKINTINSSFNLQSLKLDIVQQVEMIQNHDPKKALKFDRSLYGLAFDDKIEIAYLPEQLIAHTLIDNKSMLRLKHMKEISSLSPFQKKDFNSNSEFTLYKFTAQSWYKSRMNTISLFRGHQLFEKIDANLLLSAAISAGNYLQTAVKESGEFVYEYLPKKDIASKRYNILRHAGTVYAMLELYEVTGDEILLKSIKLALSYLISQAKVIRVKDEKLLGIVEDDFVKLGANALSILAISKYISITHDTTYLPTARKLAMWIKAAQLATGKFFIQKLQYSTLRNTTFVSEYYPGEAIFSLARLYQVDPDETWLDIAQNAAYFIIKKRNKNLSILRLPHDHWLLYGLNELYRSRPDPLYVDHTRKICQAILNAQYRKQEPPDYRGSFYQSPRSTPVAIRAEGLCAAYSLLNNNDYREDANVVLDAVKLCIQFQLQTQYQPEKALYLSNPQRTLGGFSRSLTDYSIRIDYVQHNLSSLLALYHIISQPSCSL